MCLSSGSPSTTRAHAVSRVVIACAVVVVLGSCVTRGPAPQHASHVHCDRYVSPSQSITNALANAKAGDVTCVHKGVYSEKVMMRRSGVTVRNVPGEVPVVDGSRLAIGEHDGLWNIGGGVVNVTVQGFTIRNSSGRGLVNDGSHNRVFDNTITNIRNSGLMTTNWSGAAIDNLYFGNEISFTVRANDCHVVRDPCRATGGWESAIDHYSGGSKPAGHNVYAGNRVHDNGGEGATVMDYERFVGNVMHDNFGAEIYLNGTQHATIEHNFLYETERQYLPIGRNESYRLLARGIGLADEVRARSSSNILRSNIIVNTRDGIQFWHASSGSGLKGDTIEQNTIVNTWDYGIAIDAGSHSSTSVRNNIVVPRRGHATRGLPTRGITVTANLFTTRGARNDPHIRGEGTFSFSRADYATRDVK
jgi:parallel beta helix pectate lyase-like protein